MTTKEMLQAIKNFKETRYYSPYAVFATKNPDEETIDQIQTIQEKFLNLPESEKNKLVSPQTEEIIKKIGEDFKLQLWQIADISSAIRSYYFKELPLTNFTSHLIEKVGTNQKQTQEITQRLIKNVFESESLGQRNLIYLPLAEALIKYPQLKKQPITFDSIKIRDFATLVLPSIENWLQDYQQTAGGQKHDSVERSDYLFNSANTKNLTPPERQKLSAILQSADENSTIAIDPEKQIIIFGLTQTPETTIKKDATRPAIANKTIPSAQKTLRQLAQDNKNALNQNLTTSPIKVADFDQPVRPTIKNWLVDYVKIKGAGHHASLERSDYLFNSPNAKALPAKERALVAEILRAYDDDLTLPINESDQNILLDKLSVFETPRFDRTTSPPPSASASTPSRPQPASQYREPISQEDLSGPTKQTPPKPTPRLTGNIIDLKDLQ
ncbi:hypothetical protein KJ866_04665 [Patescibacteria group bacterium]|nr:hypothetical protein [Patescibacteria group bacterium]